LIFNEYAKAMWKLYFFFSRNGAGTIEYSNGTYSIQIILPPVSIAKNSEQQQNKRM
jgi:hypothetical protein